MGRSCNPEHFKNVFRHTPKFIKSEETKYRIHRLHLRFLHEAFRFVQYCSMYFKFRLLWIDFFSILCCCPPFKQSTKNLLETPCGFWFYILYGLPCLNSLEYFMAAMFECLTFIGCDAGLALKRLVLDNSLGFCPSFSCAPACVEIDARTNVSFFCPRFIVCTSHGQ